MPTTPEGRARPQAVLSAYPDEFLLGYLDPANGLVNATMTSITPVPEPGTAILAGLGLVILSTRARRSRS